MPGPPTSDELLLAFTAGLETALARHAGEAGSAHRRLAAGRLAIRLRRIAEAAPDAPADENSQQAIKQAMEMIRIVLPSWSLRTKGAGGDA
jgi:hypothetical protein